MLVAICWILEVQPDLIPTSNKRIIIAVEIAEKMKIRNKNVIFDKNLAIPPGFRVLNVVPKFDETRLILIKRARI